MLLADGTLGLVMLVLWVFCVADCIISDEARVRSLPKLLWLLIVLVLPDVGSVLWLVLGRPAGRRRLPARCRRRAMRASRRSTTGRDAPSPPTPMTTPPSCASCATAPSSSAAVPSSSARPRIPTRRH